MSEPMPSHEPNIHPKLETASRREAQTELSHHRARVTRCLGLHVLPGDRSPSTIRSMSQQVQGTPSSAEGWEWGSVHQPSSL